MPLPPPPPPGPPPPPSLGSMPPLSPAANPKDRGALLQSIRAGTRLKPTQTKDRSAPIIGNNVNGRSSRNEESSVSPSSIKPGFNTLPRHGLGGLFANGMPTLRPTNHSAVQSQSVSMTTLPQANSSSLHNSTTSLNNNHNSRGNRPEFGRKDRGPPPQPPSQSQQKLSSSASDNTLTPFSQHSRNPSMTSLPNGGWMQEGGGGGGGRPSKPKIAPKPPAPRVQLHRAQSMKNPVSLPVLPLSAKRGEQLSESSVDLRGGMVGPGPQGKRLLKPIGRPPPPPRNYPPPPPPPNQPPPPPPPHKTNSPSLPISRTAPPVPSTDPPPLPMRSDSLHKNGILENFGARFGDRFHSVKDFPPPQPFMGVLKVYNSKTAKQQAPQPPSAVAQQIQFGKLWDHNNTSTC